MKYSRGFCFAFVLGFVSVAASQMGDAQDPSTSPFSSEKVMAYFSRRMPGCASAQLSRHLMTLTRRYQMDPALILSLIDVESTFRPAVVSNQGAVGLMQILPSTAEDVYTKYHSRSLKRPRSFEKALKDPFFNLTIGMSYLNWLRTYYDGDMQKALTAYNAGLVQMERFLVRSRYFKSIHVKSIQLAARN